MAIGCEGRGAAMSGRGASKALPLCWAIGSVRCRGCQNCTVVTTIWFFVRGVLKTHVMRLGDAGGACHIREGFGEVEFSDGAGNDEKLPDVRLEWQA